jgi:hypothetical protein
MRLAAAERATDLGVVKLLLTIAKFLWQVMACEDNVPNDLLMIKQDWTASPPCLQRLPASVLWHKSYSLHRSPQLFPSGINGQSGPFL